MCRDLEGVHGCRSESGSRGVTRPRPRWPWLLPSPVPGTSKGNDPETATVRVCDTQGPLIFDPHIVGSSLYNKDTNEVRPSIVTPPMWQHTGLGGERRAVWQGVGQGMKEDATLALKCGPGGFRKLGVSFLAMGFPHGKDCTISWEYI